MSRPISALISQDFALVGSLPLAPAKIRIKPETMIAIVTMVPINMVAERTISWTKSPTEVGSHGCPSTPGFLMLVLMPNAS